MITLDTADRDSLAIPGRLRPEVKVSYGADAVTIEFGYWVTKLPKHWLISHPVAADLLRRKVGLVEAIGDSGTAAVATLLEQQGCFIPHHLSGAISLQEVLNIFEPLKQSWYAAYYSHPLWQDLSNGRATQNELVAWLIHNYHVSRSAGVVAARISSMNVAWSDFFANDAISEYWHCDAFYFINSDKWQISAQEIKDYIHLPASLAFEQHCLQVAETDFIGHLLIAYFQEASICFREESEEFYRRVEDSYSIPNFFDKWRDHIQVDVDQKHSDSIKNLFSEKIKVSLAELGCALRNAWIAFNFLQSSLDQIRSQANETIRLRSQFELAYNPPIQEREHFYSQNYRLSEHRRRLVVELLLQELRESAFRALAFSRSHNDIMFAGSVARVLTNFNQNKLESRYPWIIAVGNFLNEVAVISAQWSSCARMLIRRLCLVDSAGVPDQLVTLSCKFSCTTANASSELDINSEATLLGQFDEILILAVSKIDSVPSSIDSWLA